MIISRGASRQTVSLACLLWLTGCGGDGPGGDPRGITDPTRTWQLQGTVSESGTAKRLSAVRVEVIDGPNAKKFASSDSNGAYQITGLTQGGFSVRASGTGHESVTQGVTLTSDQTIDFSLPMAAPVLFASFDPATITVKDSGDAEYPNELDFNLFVQESNYVDVWVEAIYYRLATLNGEPSYWDCDYEWLRQHHAPLRVGGGSTKIFHMILIYDGPIEAGTLTTAVEVRDSLGNVSSVFGNAKVQPASSGLRTGLPADRVPRPPPLAPQRR